MTAKPLCRTVIICCACIASGAYWWSRPTDQTVSGGICCPLWLLSSAQVITSQGLLEF